MLELMVWAAAASVQGEAALEGGAEVSLTKIVQARRLHHVSWASGFRESKGSGGSGDMASGIASGCLSKTT